ncbi:ribosome biogenesis GTPase Der [Blattabacterium cuenoti]|uniref:ribosome biogenesis GTPase Der n=1 Tax=Blattabacterium cuenoti TaxID=1653831 RepID=UPI00163BC42B|nr:ribosome biogenesis GTPase Der [Blattabacterium cuenoti]
MNYTVSIIGRSNVGKSTLFNRIIGVKKSITHKYSGITRDRVCGYLKWNEIKFLFLDTGGFNISNNDIIQIEINKQIIQSINESDIILLLIDITTGLLNEDIELSNIIRKYNKPIFLVINKIDHKISSFDTDFYSLGFNNYYYVSAVNGIGIVELLDKISIILTKNNENEFEKNKKKLNDLKIIPKLSIVGRPNVGKSTLINSLMKKSIHIVTSIPGTTRDNLSIICNKTNEYKCILIDTPGMRKKSKVKEIEFYSITRTLKSIESSDVCLLIIDAYFGWEKQDMNIFNLIKNNYKGIVIIVNKWDLFYNNKNESLIKKKYEIFIKKKVYPIDSPILFISAKNKYNVHKIIPLSFKIKEKSTIRLKTNILNKIMLPIIKNNPPLSYKNKLITIKYCTQLPSNIPKFVFFSNFPQYIKKSYVRFIENKIRYHFNFKGIPIKIFFRKK